MSSIVVRHHLLFPIDSAVIHRFFFYIEKPSQYFYVSPNGKAPQRAGCFDIADPCRMERNMDAYITENDNIRLTAGYYTFPVGLDINAYNVTISSEEGNSKTIVDFQNSRFGWNFQFALIQGITFINFQDKGLAAAGLSFLDCVFTNSTDLVTVVKQPWTVTWTSEYIQFVSFTRCLITNLSGATFVANISTITIDSCKFDGNSLAVTAFPWDSKFNTRQRFLVISNSEIVRHTHEKPLIDFQAANISISDTSFINNNVPIVIVLDQAKSFASRNLTVSNPDSCMFVYQFLGWPNLTSQICHRYPSKYYYSFAKFKETELLSSAFGPCSHHSTSCSSNCDASQLASLSQPRGSNSITAAWVLFPLSAVC